MAKNFEPKAGSMNRVRETVLKNSSRSSMHRWMLSNATEFAALLDEVRRPDWTVIAEALAAEGLLDGLGKSPSKETTRQTWWKVQKVFDTPPPPTRSRPPPVQIIREPTKPAPPPAPTPPDDDAEPAALTEMRERMRAATSIKRKKE